jgi:WD40 repeat protein
MEPKPLTNAAKELGKPLLPPCQVTRLRFSPDGKIVAAACIDGLVRRWNVAGKEPVELPALTGHSCWVTGLVYGKSMLATGDSWGRLTSWDAEGERKWTVETAHDGWLRMIDIAPDGRGATCGKDGFVRTWNADGKKIGDIVVKSGPLAICFSPDGKTLLTGDLFGIVREHEPAGKVVRTFEAKELYKLDRIQDVGGVRCLLFDPAGKTLLVAGAIPTNGANVQCTPLIVAFDRATGKRLWQWKGASENEGFVTDLAWHPDGYLVGSASGQPGQGKVFFLKPGEAAPFFVSAKPNVHSVAIHPDGSVIAAALTNANNNGNGRVRGASYLPNVSPIQFWHVPKPK